MKKRTLFLSTIVGIGLVVAGVYGVRWWITAMNTVSTDDARVTASYATISAEVSGRIVKFPVDEGDLVKKGALLVQIDHENYKSALEESLAELDQASAQFAEERIHHKAMKATVRSEISRAEASVEAARGILKEKKRMVELAKLVTKTQRDQVGAALKVAESNLAAGDVELKNATVELERSKTLFKNQFISAKDLDTAKMAYDRALATVDMRKSEVLWARADLGLAQVSKLNNFRDDAKLAEAKIVTARSDLKKSQANLRLAKARLAELDAFKARLKSQESKISQLKLQVGTKRRHLEGTEVRSPVNGIVVRKTADLGDIIETGQPILKVVIEGTLEVRANIRETYLRHIQRGNPVEVYVDAYPQRVFSGKVRIIGDATDSEFALFRPSGQFTKLEQVIPVEISLDGHSNNRDLKPGMNVVVYIKRTGSIYGKSSMRARAEQRSP
jgi:membrane fusion protein (multidrug efflux system)